MDDMAKGCVPGPLEYSTHNFISMKGGAFQDERSDNWLL